MPKNIDKACIIAGNAPSLANIDYARLPEGLKIFRCNQFYLEDKYYLGKQIDGYFLREGLFLENYYTMMCLESSGQYQVGSVFTDRKSCELFETKQKFEEFFPKVRIIEECARELDKFYEFMQMRALFYASYPTMGVMMCACAIAMGYREIYIAGMDFYQEGVNTYAFGNHQKNLNTLMPRFQIRGFNTDSSWHSKSMDLMCLELLQKEYHVKFYALCPDSVLSDYIPLAPVLNKSIYYPEDKPEDAIKDILIPPSKHYKRVRHFRSNLWMRVFRDLKRLGRDMKEYLAFQKS